MGLTSPSDDSFVSRVRLRGPQSTYGTSIEKDLYHSKVLRAGCMEQHRTSPICTREISDISSVKGSREDRGIIVRPDCIDMDSSSGVRKFLPDITPGRARTKLEGNGHFNVCVIKGQEISGPLEF